MGIVIDTHVEGTTLVVTLNVEKINELLDEIGEAVEYPPLTPEDGSIRYWMQAFAEVVAYLAPLIDEGDDGTESAVEWDDDDYVTVKIIDL